MMTNVFYTLFIALTNNIDNISARIAYSIRGIRISIPINIWISVITFVISAFAAFSGTMITGFVSKRLSSIIAMLLLTAIGLWMMAEPYMKKNNESPEDAGQENGKNVFSVMMKPEYADKDHSKHIDFKEATVLGVALSINNIGGGISAGVIGLSPLWVGLLSAVINFLALWMGNYIARIFIAWNLSKKATVVAGMILIAIGIEQIF
jgi:putative sporulation protein YtaF